MFCIRVYSNCDHLPTNEAKHICVRLSYNTIHTTLLITLQIPCSCPAQVFQGLASKRSNLAYERADFLKKKNPLRQALSSLLIYIRINKRFFFFKSDDLGRKSSYSCAWKQFSCNSVQERNPVCARSLLSDHAGVDSRQRPSINMDRSVKSFIPKRW